MGYVAGMTTDTGSEFLTVPEVARILRLSAWSVRQRIARGEIDAIRLGDGPKARIRVAEGDLVAYLRRVNG